VVVLTLSYCFAFHQQKFLVLKGIMVINPNGPGKLFSKSCFYLMN